MIIFYQEYRYKLIRKPKRIIFLPVAEAVILVKYKNCDKHVFTTLGSPIRSQPESAMPKKAIHNDKELLQSELGKSGAID